jgi:sialate O-acetylesterase
MLVRERRIEKVKRVTPPTLSASAPLGEFLVFLCLLCAGLHAEVTMPAIFGDHMVLQQGMTLPVWGKAAPGEEIAVRIAGRRGVTKADAAGRWRITLRPLPKSFTPEILVVEGSNRIEIHDVLIGDVWICAGGGNMEFPVSDSVTGREVAGSLKDRGLRFFTVGKAARAVADTEGSGRWVVCSPSEAASFSAVGYFFALDLRASQRIPVGMIACAWDESPAEAWISPRGLQKSPSFATHHAGSHREGEGSPGTPTAVMETTPSALFNGMIAPLIPYALTGVIWYHGESDEGDSALRYRRLFPRLIRDWREAWGEGPFPFFFVSLAGYGSAAGPAVEPFRNERGQPRRGWPWIREGASAALSIPFTGMAVATDLGVQDERQPPGKLDVARRLALLARHRVYGEDLVDSGPLFRSMAIEGKRIRIGFDSVGGGLCLGAPPWSPGVPEPLPATLLRGFAIAGGDRKWFPATARIEGTTVVLSSDAVPHPRAVRYNWKGFPDGNLYNKEGLPAPPFRTDCDQPD